MNINNRYMMKMDTLQKYMTFFDIIKIKGDVKMIKQNYVYDCDPNDLADANKLILRVKQELESKTLDIRNAKDEIMILLDKLTAKRNDFMSDKEDEVINKFKEIFNLEDANFQELFEKVPLLTEYFHMRFSLNPNCEKVIDDLINLFSTLNSLHYI